MLGGFITLADPEIYLYENLRKIFRDILFRVQRISRSVLGGKRDFADDPRRRSGRRRTGEKETQKQKS